MVSTDAGSYDNIFQSLLDIASSMEQQQEFARELPGEHNILIGQDGMPQAGFSVFLQPQLTPCMRI
jgi:hypothetical protein